MKRVAYFDVLNIVSCFSVVILHANGAVHDFVHDETWWLRVLYEVIFYFAVPCFFMLSGATLIKYRDRYDTITFFKKRIKRTVIPFLFFSFIFLLLAIVRDYEKGKSVNLIGYLGALCLGKLPLTNYWFFIPLFLLYLFMPVLSVLFRNLSIKNICMLAAIIIGLQTIIWPVQMRLGGSPSHLPMDSYVAYILLGGALSDIRIKISKKVYYMFFLGALFFLAIRYIVIYNSFERNQYVMTYNGLWAYLSAIFLFLYAKNHFSQLNKKTRLMLNKISSYSFGVYLIHGLVLALLSKLIYINDSSLFHTIILAPLTFIICLFIAAIIKHFRFTKWMM